MLALVYTFAFVSALVTLWAFLALGVIQYFESRLDSIFITMLFSLLSAMCMFSLVYGLATGVALKWKYWLFGTVAMAALVQFGPHIVTLANMTLAQAFVVSIGLVYLVGFILAYQRDALRDA
ncbi:MAG: hypothetical protein AB8B82_16910 [Roseovarius sp.]